MGFLFGRKGRNETDGRRDDVAKKSASVLAAVAVAGGSAVVGMPAAEARTAIPFLYLEKKNKDGDFIGGSKWRVTVDEWVDFEDDVQKYGRLCHAVPMSVIVSDNQSTDDVGEDLVYKRASDFLTPEEYEIYRERNYPDECIIESVNVSDVDLEDGKILFDDEFQGLAKKITITEIESPEGYGPGSEGPPSVTFERRSVVTYDVENEKWVYEPEPEDGMGIDVVSSSGLYEPVVGKYRFGDDYYRGQHHKPEYEGTFPDGSKASNYWVYPVGQFTNVRITEPTTVTETVTETPKTSTTTVTQPVTTTVTPPTTTVTLPTTVTSTVTPPPATVTETPKTETTTATTTESATTTVTEPAKTETVTETPQRETVTETPAPKTETVTETPKKETVTETPKASTETMTSTVTAPQVTVTETPNQVTETTTLPQKTVTQQVPTTVVKDQTETVKMPPVTVTETEKQEPVTVSAIPQTVTETVKVPGENTTVVVTEPGEPTTVRETVTEETTSVVPVVVDEPKPSAPAPAPAPAPEQAVEAPVEVKQEPANGVRNVLATTGAETNVVLGLGAGVLAMLALVAIVRRKKA